ncbi:MAG: hypothetical protein Kow00121_04530 [Elainellaceae cyanobacterium]
MKINMYDYFSRLPKDETLYYFPNPGNGGDSLIACATFQMLDKYKLKYCTINEKSFDSSGKTILLPSAGNFVGYYSNIRNFIQKYHSAAKKIIILPASISDHEEILKELGRNVDIITREEKSYEHVKSNAQNSNVYIADDMALHLDVQQVLAQFPIVFSLLMTATIPSRRIQKGNYFKVQQHFKDLTTHRSHRTLSAFRTDKERTKIAIPDDNLDIAEIFAYGTTKKRALYASYSLLNFINTYDLIKTSRLHTCIAAALLQKKVEFYPNNYFKCEAVYQFSLKDRFPNVKWMG